MGKKIKPWEVEEEPDPYDQRTLDLAREIKDASFGRNIDEARRKVARRGYLKDHTVRRVR